MAAPTPAAASAMPTQPFLPLSAADSFGPDVQCITLGSGRFLRTVLVPALLETGARCVIAQPRGSSFVTSVLSRAAPEYEIDTVPLQGETVTRRVPVSAVGSLGDEAGRQAFLSLPAKLPGLRYVGVGLTEGGIKEGGEHVILLAQLLGACERAQTAGHLSVINTDNVPQNGDVLRRLVGGCAGGASDAYLDAHVTFHNTMVDCITSHREGDTVVPRAEALPAKALVIEDLQRVLPAALAEAPGVVLRRSKGLIAKDHAIKLRVANGTHSAAAHIMALSGLADTTRCADHPQIIDFLDGLYERDIAPGCVADLSLPRAEVDAAWREWRGRLRRANFGLSTFFITQNAYAKLGLRLVPTLNAALRARRLPSRHLCVAIAALLRFITPHAPLTGTAAAEQAAPGSGVDGPLERLGVPEGSSTVSWARMNVWPQSGACEEYAPGLRVDYSSGLYSFMHSAGAQQLADAWQRSASSSGGSGVAAAVVDAVLCCLEQQGMDMGSALARPAAEAVAAVYAQLVRGASVLELLEQLVREDKGADSVPTTSDTDNAPAEHTQTLALHQVGDAVRAEVAAVEVIDLHTHLLPPSHPPLSLWGIDELLTYHYLVAEYFMAAAPPHAPTPEAFHALPKQRQAELVWAGLFLDRSPLSEAARGVLTTLSALGLEAAARRRDLGAIRAWFAEQEAEAYAERVFSQAGVRYCVMTNVPFDAAEVRHWRPTRAQHSARFRAALRVDPLLKGDVAAVLAAVRSEGLPETLEGVRRYLRGWADTLRPEYLMASTPHDFHVAEEEVRAAAAAHDAAVAAGVGAAAAAAEQPVGGGSELLLRVLLPLAEELRLPLALKLGAHRGVNPGLRGGGDGVVTGQVCVLRLLLTHFPRVKFLGTFLARSEQHEAVVLANKFGNFHLYGCWWYCNNPSMIAEITAMRLEMLGTAFTAQHSDARVLDQLLYKWQHSRAVIGDVLAAQFEKMVAAGWSVTREEVRRGVWRLFGGAYEEFMAKELLL